MHIFIHTDPLQCMVVLYVCRCFGYLLILLFAHLMVWKIFETPSTNHKRFLFYWILHVCNILQADSYIAFYCAVFLSTLCWCNLSCHPNTFNPEMSLFPRKNPSEISEPARGHGKAGIQIFDHWILWWLSLCVTQPPELIAVSWTASTDHERLIIKTLWQQPEEDSINKTTYDLCCGNFGKKLLVHSTVFMLFCSRSKHDIQATFSREMYS